MARENVIPSLPELKKKAGRRWSDAQWQLRHAARTPATLRAWLGVAVGPQAEEVARRFPMRVTPYYASLALPDDSADPIARMATPSAEELFENTGDPDPFAEAGHMPVPGLIRRYEDRAVLLASQVCAVYCRHCTRKHSVGPVGRGQIRRAGKMREAPSMPDIAAWLRGHPEVREILVSGGDPLLLSDARIQKILETLRGVPSVEVIRMGSRVPVVMPMRITRDLAKMLSAFHPLWLNTHFNHPRELTPEAQTACARLADAGIPLGNQAVLLRGVNDRVETLEELFRGLIRMRVRPYYLLQCDPVRGAGHFRVRLRRALEMMDELRARLSGIAVPQFVVDAAEGAGKIPLLPTRVERFRPREVELRAPRGLRVRYPEP